MNATRSPKSLSLPNLSLLRDLLDALASLHDLSDPFASISQLQNALATLTKLAATLGLNANWLAWLQSLQNDSQLLNIVLAIGQYL
jgi:hypothetical protein